MNDVPGALLEILADGEEVLWWGMPDRRPHPTWRDFLEMPVAVLCAYVSYAALRAMWATPVIIIGFLWPLIFALVPLFVFVVFPIQYVRLKRRTYFAVTNRRVVRLYAGRKTVLGDSRPLDLIGWVSALRCGKSSVHDLYIGKKPHLADTRDIRDYTGGMRAPRAFRWLAFTEGSGKIVSEHTIGSRGYDNDVSKTPWSKWKDPVIFYETGDAEGAIAAICSQIPVRRFYE